MNVFKKLNISIIIMLVCIILAIVIGIARKPFYTNLSYNTPASEQTISQDLNEMTTYGKISQAVYNVLHSGDDVDGFGKEGLGIIGFVVIVIAILLVLKILVGNNK